MGFPRERGPGTQVLAAPRPTSPPSPCHRRAGTCMQTEEMRRPCVVIDLGTELQVKGKRVEGKQVGKIVLLNRCGLAQRDQASALDSRLFLKLVAEPWAKPAARS